MKKICYLVIILQYFSSFADEVFYPEGGVYVGVGISNAKEAFDFEVKNVVNGLDYYEYLKDKNSPTNFCSQLFVGYKKYAAVFLAVELNLSLNKREYQKTFSETVVPEQDTTALRIKSGNDIALVVKLGKTFSYITPYFLVGTHIRKMGFDYTYPYTANNNQKNNRNYERYTANWILGCGIAFYIQHGFEIAFEYCSKKHRKINYNSICPDTDADGYPRMYSLGSKQHCFSMAISKTL